MRLLTPSEYRRVPWKNGLGTTLEVCTDAARPGGEWTWRLSVADMPMRAPFSSYPGLDRFIACLEGPGFDLERAGKRIRAPDEGSALGFSGEEAIVGCPLGPGVRDLNLMLRRDRWRGRMILARAGALALEAPIVLVHIPEGSPPRDVSLSEGTVVICSGNTLIAEGSVTVEGAPSGSAAGCELKPV